ncbi:uncharacterized protein LOC132742699 [Ruditapes philippinarum]|uniref:uncharacterized protein LOC132742699 n=1 Tax=Ruditapes philippinarum TaxID=129788 RepID=UPI00295AA0BC|nr:uncharacterized protein LOC132742699 [Ruditapes philippinarum]
MKFLFCLALAAMVTVQYCSACTCSPNNTVQEKYCNADFLILVKVLNDGIVYGGNRVYRINLIATYRSKVYGGVDVRKLYTATNSAACGVILQKGYYYILTGYYPRNIRQRQIHTGLCYVQQRFRFNPQRVYKPPRCN